MKTLPLGLLSILLCAPLAAQAPPQGNVATQRIQDQIYKGDLDGLRERRMLRVGVAYNRTHYSDPLRRQ